MTIPTVSLSETIPANTGFIRDGASKVREMKTQYREIIAVDHDMDSSGQDGDFGKHKQVTLIEQADIGTGAAGYAALGAETVGTKPELTYTDEDDDSVQITSDGYLNATALAGVYPAVNVAALATMMALIYPVGIVITLGVSTNPATLLGIGTWTAIAEKVIVGKHSSGTFDTLDATGGAETVTLDETTMPGHTHTWQGYEHGAGGAYGNADASNANSDGLIETSSTGDDGAHANLQPYIVKYIWQRTA